MIVLKDVVLTFVKEWLEGQRSLHKKNSFIVPITNGVDSVVCASLIADMRANQKICFVNLGFNQKNEEVFRAWIEKKYGVDNFVFYYLPLEGLNHLRDVGLSESEARKSLMSSWLDALAGQHQGLVVSPTTRNEYRMVKSISRDYFDVYPLIDLHRSEVIELGEFIGLPVELLKSDSKFEKDFGVTFAELEWLDRENENTGIISSPTLPTQSRYWGMYDGRRKEIISKVYSKNKNNAHIVLPEKKMCMIRSALPGVTS